MAEKVVNVNIEAIMEEIRTEIKREQATGVGVDVTRTMEEIRAEVRERPRDAVPAFDDVPIPSAAMIPQPELAQPDEMFEDGGLTRRIVNEAQFLKTNHYIPYYRDMGKGPKSYFKRIIRKLNRCIVLPISDDQNAFNLHVANSIDALRAGFENYGPKLELQSEIAAHGEALGGQRREIDTVNAKLRDLRHNQDIQRMTLDAQQRELTSKGERLETFAEQLETFAEQLNVLSQQQKALLDSLEGQQGALDAFNGQLADIRSGLEDHGRFLEGQQGALDAFNGQLAEIRSGMADHGRSLEGQQLQLNSHKSTLDAMVEAVQRHEQSMGSIDRSIDEMSLSIARTIRHYLAAQSTQDKVAKPAVAQTTQGNGENSSETVATEEAQAQNDYEVLDYFKFENDFRGTQSQIMERQKIYLPYFRGKKGRVFDFGCGRGEFLRLLKAEGIPAYGMDMYEEYEIIGRLNGIDITTGDAFAELERVEEPLGGIFCAQVIERIGFRNIQKLCKLAYDRLEKDAYLVLETPNPMCVSTFANFFYLDPTHERPVHPLMMEYLLKSTGFSEVQLLWPDHSLEPLPKIRGNGIENLDEVNRAIERVSNLLFGSQDYAVIARK